MGCDISFGRLCCQEREDLLKANGCLGHRKNHCHEYMSEDTLQFEALSGSIIIEDI